jgi:hypothetical protein
MALKAVAVPRKAFKFSLVALVARSSKLAMRHRAPFLDVDDWPYSVSNPRQSNDCSHADDSAWAI